MRNSKWPATSLAILIVVALMGATPGAAAQEPPGSSASSGPPEHARAEGYRDMRGESPDPDELDGLDEQARRAGTVRVIVGLKVEFVPEGAMDAGAVGRQRAEIARQRRAVQSELHPRGGRTVAEFDTVPFVAMELPEHAVQALRESRRVASVQVDEAVPPSLGESTPLVQGNLMHAAGFTGAGQMVAVLDSGVDTSHAFFGGRVVEEACYSTTSSVNGSTSVCPGGASSSTATGSGVQCTGVAECGHGTHVAGISAGSGASFGGVAPAANLMAVQVFSQFTGTNCGTGPDPCVLSYISDQIKGLERVYALRTTHAIAAANLSLGGGQYTSSCDATNGSYKTAIDNLRSVGIATVVAAGNNGWTDAVSAPGCISTAVTVGSTTKADAVSSFSNSHPTMIDLYAPGSAINSSVVGGGFEAWNGTSMAAPHVAGAWAILRHAKPAATVTELLADLQATGLPVTDDRSTDPALHHTHPRILINDARTGEPSLSVTKTGAGQGTVTSSPAGIDCGTTCTFAFAPGTEVTLTAAPASDSTFTGWSGAGCSGTGTCTVTLSETTAVNAAFDVPPPDNDGFAAATAISALPYTRSQSTTLATTESGEPVPTCDSTAGATVWYRYTPTTSARLTADTIGSTFDTVLQVYSGTDLAALTAVGCHFGDASPWYDSIVAFDPTPGTTYYFQVGGYEGGGGDLVFNLTAANSPPSAVDDELATTVNSAGSVDVLANDTDPDGDALTVQSWTQPASGSVTCQATGLCTYTPDMDFAGADTFSYTAADPEGVTDTATVVVLVRNDAVFSDFDGDGTTDVAVFRPTNGRWYIRGIATIDYGTNGDIPVAGDYNGDGTTDVAVFRPSTGTWHVRGVGNTAYGTNGDIPVAGDYNGDGTTDIAVFRPSTGTWHVRGVGNTAYGTNGDIPVAGDYNGDGAIDIAVFRPSTGTWHVRGVGNTAYGTNGDIPVAADYSGDGAIDIAVFRPSTGTWHVRGVGNTAYGTNGDIPLSLRGSLHHTLFG